MSVTTAETARQVRIMLGEGMSLDAEVTIPPAATGVVVFAHGSGSGHLSPRNQYVARELNAQHLATVLADLLTLSEQRVDERTLGLRFDIPLLARRVERVIDWTHDDSELSALAIGVFGASTGAAAALDAAALRPDLVRAVVSRGGRPDLASKLDRVSAPTLLIVGGNDKEVIGMNESALRKMKCAKQMAIVPGATHLFEEAGMLERVAALAGKWFNEHLQPIVVRP